MDGELMQDVETEPAFGREVIKASRVSESSGSRSASSQLLTTMAVVVATADEGKDYLAFFLPFVADRLKAWPEGEPVEPHELSRALCEAWSFPSVPIAVARILLARAQSAGLVSNIERRYYANHEQLLGVPDLAEKRQEMLAGLRALTDAVLKYAREVHGLRWDEQQANEALERLTEDFGAELATARRDGALVEVPDDQQTEALAVVHGFARRALERDPENFDRLVTMVQGTMIANALYFEDIRKMPNRLPDLRVFLDTTPLLRALGLAPPELVAAAQEMLALMRSFKTPMFVFTHTVDELTAILERIATSLKRGTRGNEEQGRLGGRAREAIDAVVQSGMTSGDLQALIANLECALGDIGVRRCETPRHAEAEHIDEVALQKILDERIQYLSKGPLEKDLESLAAVDRLRGGKRPRQLAQTTALFVTANAALAASSRSFFREAGRDAPIPHCMSDIALTAQLWVGSSQRKPDLPRRLLIADSYSALAPSPELWERWVSHIVRLRNRGQISEEQLQTLIYHQQVKALLFEVARGKAENVDDTAVAEVIARHEAALRKPLEEEAETARQAADRDRDELLTKIRELNEWKQQQERQARDRDRDRVLHRARMRATAGVLVGLVVAAIYAFLALSDAIHGKFWWATATTLLVFLGATAISWGLRKGWRVPVGALVTAGAISAFWVNVFGVAAATKMPTSADHTPTVISSHPPSSGR